MPTATEWSLYVGWSVWIIICLNWLQWERAVCWVNYNFHTTECVTLVSTETLSVLIETQVRQESFSALCLLVWTCAIVKSIKNWNPVPRLNDMTHQMKKEINSLENLSEFSGFTWVLRLHYLLSKDKVRKTRVHCWVNWPGCKWWTYLFPLHIKPRS